MLLSKNLDVIINRIEIKFIKSVSGDICVNNT